MVYSFEYRYEVERLEQAVQRLESRLWDLERQVQELEEELRELRRTAYTSCDEIIECTSG